MDIQIEHVRQKILSLSQLHEWSSEVKRIFSFESEIVPIDWLFPIRSAKALRQDEEAILPVVSALACLYRSIILVDDILDDDPDGLHLRLGTGRAANLALALQAASIYLTDQCDVTPDRRLAACLTINQAAMDTSAGQELDSQNLVGEENYWKLVQAKSTPYYGAAFKVGSQLAGANNEMAKQFYAFGKLVGELSQIYDDLEDAFAVPAEPDWTQGRSNLAILYGLTADYEEKERFTKLCKHIDEDCLAEAQEVLARSGAVSYCIYQALQREEKARHLIDSLPLYDSRQLTDLLPKLRAPIDSILKQAKAPDLQILIAT